MSNLHLVAVIDEARGLGMNNQLLCHLPADLKHFKAVTLGHPVIMGRKTYESIGKPLPGRFNIVISRQAPPFQQPMSSLPLEGVIMVPSLEAALTLTTSTAAVMVIGGAAVFEQALPLAQHMHLTTIHHVFEADVFFPPINLAEWMLVETHERSRDEKNPYDLTFSHFKRKNL